MTFEKTLSIRVAFTGVAISHQTQRLEGQIGDKHFRGWDYLIRSFARSARKDPSWLEPVRLASLTTEQLLALLGNRDVIGLEARVRLLRDLGIKQMRMNSIETFHDSADGWLMTKEGNGILQRLAAFEAYKDPVRKKASYFCAIMKNHGIWEYMDPQSLPPPVDYHELRGYLRLGTVRLDRKTQRQVASATQLSQTDDVNIRQAVLEAISAVAMEAGVDPNQMHYAFWNLFRNVCLRRSPLCDGPAPPQLPPRYGHLGSPGCKLREQCLAYQGEVPMMTEPQVETLFY